MQTAAIIVAGGQGNRMQSSTPKQFLPLRGMPVLMHTITQFYKANTQTTLVIVLPIAWLTHWQQLCQQHNFTIPHTTVGGGPTRFHSVKSGLAALENLPATTLVAVHDGARPLATPVFIQSCFAFAKYHGNAVPALTATETVRQADGSFSTQLNRDTIKLIQTPQIFSLKSLTIAYQRPYSETFTDDASVIESSGERIHLCDGQTNNLKITTPTDIAIAEALLNN